MNAPDLHRTILKRHIATVEARYPLRVLGVLPQGSATHLSDPNSLALLAAKEPGLDLLAFCEAEADLADLLGRPVGLVLLSGLKGEEAATLPTLAVPL